jgi:hypothetical protein
MHTTDFLCEQDRSRKLIMTIQLAEFYLTVQVERVILHTCLKNSVLVVRGANSSRYIRTEYRILYIVHLAVSIPIE